MTPRQQFARIQQQSGSAPDYTQMNQQRSGNMNNSFFSMYGNQRPDMGRYQPPMMSGQFGNQGFRQGMGGYGFNTPTAFGGFGGPSQGGFAGGQGMGSLPGFYDPYHQQRAGMMQQNNQLLQQLMGPQGQQMLQGGGGMGNMMQMLERMRGQMGMGGGQQPGGGGFSSYQDYLENGTHSSSGGDPSMIRAQVMPMSEEQWNAQSQQGGQQGGQSGSTNNMPWWWRNQQGQGMSARDEAQNMGGQPGQNPTVAYDWNQFANGTQPGVSRPGHMTPRPGQNSLVGNINVGPGRPSDRPPNMGIPIDPIQQPGGRPGAGGYVGQPPSSGNRRPPIGMGF